MMKLINNDCLVELDKFVDNSFDTIIIDPPYEILLNHKIEIAIDWENLSKKLFRVLKKDKLCCIFGRQPFLMNKINPAMIDAGFKFKKEIIWYKGRRSNPLHYIGHTFENIYIYEKGNAKYNTNYRVDYVEHLLKEHHLKGYKMIKRLAGLINQNKKSNLTIKEILNFDYKKNGEDAKLTNNVEYDNKYNHLPKVINRKYSIIQHLCNGKKPHDIFNFPEFIYQQSHNMQKMNNEKNNIKHPTVKPIQLLNTLVQLTSLENDKILDCFGGSGTTALACKETNRDITIIEIDSEYCKIIEDRYETHIYQNELF